MGNVVVMTAWEVENVNPEGEIAVLAEYVRSGGLWDDEHVTTKRRALGMARLALSYKQQLEDEEKRCNRLRAEKENMAKEHCHEVANLRFSLNVTNAALDAVNADKADLQVQLEKAKAELAGAKPVVDTAEYPPPTAFDQAADKLRECHAGFFEGDDPYGDISLAKKLGISPTSIPLVRLERLVQQSKLCLNTEDLKEMAYLATLAYSYALVEDKNNAAKNSAGDFAVTDSDSAK